MLLTISFYRNIRYWHSNLTDQLYITVKGKVHWKSNHFKIIPWNNIARLNRIDFTPQLIIFIEQCTGSEECGNSFHIGFPWVSRKKRLSILEILSIYQVVTMMHRADVLEWWGFTNNINQHFWSFMECELNVFIQLPPRTVFK